MLIDNLNIESYPGLALHDPIHRAVELMQDFDCIHLPVLSHDEYIGLMSRDVLLAHDNDEEAIEKLEGTLLKVHVSRHDHFLKAVQYLSDHNLSVMPVLDEGNSYLGVVTLATLNKKVSAHLGLNEPGALIVLELENYQYSLTEINRVVESNDAQITQLNTITNPENGQLLITIKINKPEVSDIIAGFQRYEYRVKYYFGEEHYTNILKDNYDNLISYLNI